MADILLVEDTPTLSRLYLEALQKAGHSVTIAETGLAALDICKQKMPTLVLLDLHLPDMNGMEILRSLKSGRILPIVIVVTAFSSINVAVEAMREGAYDFLAKPFPIERLIVTVNNALEARRLSHVVAAIKEGEIKEQYQGFIGSSPIMQSIYRIIDHLASSKATVFITGESGTGKEVCAEAIHNASSRAGKPFIALNCAAIPHDLIESEIFGHIKGAFTGAISDRDGAAVQANGGTLFLDEICEMDLSLQPKLLRFLQTNCITPVGSAKTQKIDVRIIAATNRDPLEEVEAGRFREDLYYRLHVVPLALPRLAERDNDVILIARSFLSEYAAEEGKKFAHFSDEVEERLRHYSWPGNIRQLQNTIRNIVALNDGTEITLDMLPPPLDGIDRSLQTLANSRAYAMLSHQHHKPEIMIKPLRLAERTAIEDALMLCEGNIPRAAALLEVSPSTLYRKRMNWTGAEEQSLGV